MFYSASIQTTAGTSEANAKTTFIKVSDGVIHELGVYFPAGCSGLVYCQIYDGGHQLFPSTQGQFVRGDDILVETKEFYEISDAPRWLTVRTWNLDDTYAHTIEVYVKILPKWAVLPVAAYEGIMGTIKSLFLGRTKA